jgi:hypothetical protein
MDTCSSNRRHPARTGGTRLRRTDPRSSSEAGYTTDSTSSGTAPRHRSPSRSAHPCGSREEPSGAPRWSILPRGCWSHTRDSRQTFPTPPIRTCNIRPRSHPRCHPTAGPARMTNRNRDTAAPDCRRRSADPAQTSQAGAYARSYRAFAASTMRWMKSLYSMPAFAAAFAMS